MQPSDRNSGSGAGGSGGAVHAGSGGQDSVSTSGGSAGLSTGGSFADPLGAPALLLAENVLDPARGSDLGLEFAPGTETVTIFEPGSADDHYANGVVMTAFKGELFVQWQSSPTDEDSSDTRVVYSKSADGIHWSAPITLAAPFEGGYSTSGGFWVNGDKLIVFLNVWPEDMDPRGGHVEYIESSDGTNFSDPRPIRMLDGSQLNGIFEQDPRLAPGGRIVSAAHFQPGLKVSPIYTDNPAGTSGWVRADFASLDATGEQTRELEPSWYTRSDGALVMVFRDQAGSYKKLASMSLDFGESWSTPELTNMPDSRSKQSAGNLPDGTSYLVGNPVEDRTRFPLVVALSQDGQLFDRAFLLRSEDDLQSQNYSGKAKTLGYNYPKSMVHEGYLYVAYATNKEDVEYTRVPVSALTP